MQPDKISVIIPVYNVERSLDRCVESVLRQSYGTLEVLLIDDGSTDGSSALCDRWAETDGRVRVIHGENRGVSAARNTGLDAATGNLIAFADSDDYTDPNMLSALYAALTANSADMSICNFCFVDEDDRPVADRNRNRPIRDEVLTGMEAVQKLCGERGWFYHVVWNKLYRKVLFSEIRFPTGMICSEDALIAHRLFGACEKVACIQGSYYYYVQRSDSVTHKRNTQTDLNDAEAFLDRALFCAAHGLVRCAGQTYWRAAMMLADAGRSSSFRADLHQEMRNSLRLYRKNIRLAGSCTPKEKLQAGIVWLSPSLYNSIFRNSARQRLKAALRRSPEEATTNSE